MPLPSKPPAGPVALTKNAITVLEKRYLIKDATGKPTETAEMLFWRVATVVADADRRYGATEGAVNEVADAFYRMMTESRFEPNSPTLMNAGRPLGQLSACFVLPVDASYSFMNETGPDATPVVERTMDPMPRRRENEKPVPPPLW